MNVLHKFRMLANFFLMLVLFPIVRLFPRDPKKILFGAWLGTQFADNPKYFLMYLLKHNYHLKFYWIGCEEIRPLIERMPHVQFVRKDSLMSIWHVLTAKWAVWAINFKQDISTFPTFGCVKQLSFWHGTLFKGATFSKHEVSTLPILSWYARIEKALWDFICYATTQSAFASFSNQDMVEWMQYESPISFSPVRSRAFGTSRIDYLIENKKNLEEIGRVRRKYAALLGLPLDKDWYLYMPTWRKGLSVKFSFFNSQHIETYNRVLKSKNAVLIEKQHPMVMRELSIASKNIGCLFAISSKDSRVEIDTQELLLACQRLITDYSACGVDYMLLDRPELYFMYDYDFYMKERGMSYPVEDVCAGPIIKDEKDLIHYLQKSDEELLRLKGPYCFAVASAETGEASEKFAEWVGLDRFKPRASSDNSGRA